MDRTSEKKMSPEPKTTRMQNRSDKRPSAPEDVTDSPNTENLEDENLLSENSEDDSFSDNSSVPNPIITLPKKRRSTLDSYTARKDDSAPANENKRFWLPVIPILGLVLISTFVAMKETGKPVTIDSVKKEFPEQEKDLWKAISSGVKESRQWNRPSSVILTHTKQTRLRTKKLLEQLSKYAVCELSNCELEPIKLDRATFSKPELLNTNDYGVLMSYVNENLTRSGVLIVDDFQDFPGEYAMAFHFLCDQDNPLVNPSFFFFSMEVNRPAHTKTENLKNVETLLREKWKNLNDETFVPLFSRLSGMIVEVQPEK